jgi:hypothetical protein
MMNFKTAAIVLSLSVIGAIFPSRILARDLPTAPARNPIATKIFGSYQSQIWSGGSFISGTTEFVTARDGSIGGKYTMNEPTGANSGTLSQCKSLRSRVMRCVWIDRYGTGNLEMTFSENFTNFVGYWGTDRSKPEYVWVGAR